MKLPWLNEVPALEVRDGLAEVLGAVRPEETIRYTYEDAVKLAGHSCPTVASAYLMTLAGLRALWPGEVPERGEIDATVGGEPDDGSAGPISQVVTLLTGAAGDAGFRGLAGRWRRAGLLRFDPSLDGLRLRRRDTGREVTVAFDGRSIAVPADLPRLLQATLTGRATAAERARFGELWQERVRDILTGPPERVVRVELSSAERSAT